MISVAELESLFGDVRLVAPGLAEFSTEIAPDIARLGGTLKIAMPITESLPKFLEKLPEAGKIVLGVSDFSKGTNPYLAQKEALKWKRFLVKSGRSVRVVPNKTAVLSSATSLHNKLFTDKCIELIKNGKNYYRVIQVQDINSYVERDQVRPARDAKVGMLPPKLAQILINLCGDLPKKSRLLDPFCGTGVVLQEGALMGYEVYGTDLNPRMVEYSRRNLEWLRRRSVEPFFSGHDVAPARRRGGRASSSSVVTSGDSLKKGSHGSFLDASLDRATESFIVSSGDATSFQWSGPVDLVACETYLGPPMSQAPAEIKLKEVKQECRGIILGFLKNLSSQIETGTPVTIAVPAWLRPDGHYERLNLLDEIDNLRYNVVRFKNLGQRDLLYRRDGQVVAREIIVLRKK